MQFWVFISLSIVVHFILFASIFDIYFKSPLVHGMREHVPKVKPPSSRLVLFVGDGLRADKLYELDENGESRAPYLRNLMENDGSWGVSHTRVPTESRPGHVALIAGFYEDVSAILKGWKKNPVEFDSVFNKSRTTWSWGSCDILPMFSEGAGPHVHIHCFDNDLVNFAGDDSSVIDEWVFDEVETFFANAKENQTLKSELFQDKIVFFLHLLGIDTNGHSHKPMSKEYLSNIGVVDKGVKRIVGIIEDFYSHDKKTSYVFTSDHGMTDWGSHGAGLPSETLTPLIVWGSGAAKPVAKVSKLNAEDLEMTRHWQLDPRSRMDVNQADIAPLMALLLGMPVPVNSVGVLPLDYLSADPQTKSKLLLANARQMAEQFTVKMHATRHRALLFSLFAELTQSDVADLTRRSADMIAAGDFLGSQTLAMRLIDLSLRGLNYYHNYHRTLLSGSIAASFCGWIAVSLSVVLQQVSFIASQAAKSRPLKSQKSRVSRSIFLFAPLGACVSINLYLSQAPVASHLYCALPLLIWYYITTQRHIFAAGLALLQRNHSTRRSIVLYTATGVAGTWSLVLSFFHRSVLSLELVVFALLFACAGALSVKRYAAAMCLVLAAFPVLPVVGRTPNAAPVVAAGFLATVASLAAKRTLKADVTWPVLYLPFIAGILAPVALKLSELNGQVPIAIHAFSWLTLGAGWTMPLFASTRIWSRMLCIYAAQCATYLLVSLSYDALFCVLLCALLVIWIRFEFDISAAESGSSDDLDSLDFAERPLEIDSNGARRQELSLHTMRRSYMLLFFMVLAFFGVGNIASINSFDNRVVLPFITVFNHSVMGALLAYKVFLPNLLVACAFCCIAIATRTNLTQLCCFVLVISDFMSAHFFFLVRNEGSWLDIGTSISHYVISMTMIISVLFFFAAAKLLTGYKISLAVRQS